MSIQETFQIDLGASEKLAVLRSYADEREIILLDDEEMSLHGMLCGKPPVGYRDTLLRGDIVLAAETIPPTREFVLNGLFRAVQAQTEAARHQRKFAESEEALEIALRLLATS